MQIFLKWIGRPAGWVALGLAFCLLLGDLAALRGQSALSITVGSNLQRRIDFTATNNLYYILYRGDDLFSITQAVDLTAATNGAAILRDISTIRAAGFYRVISVHISTPLDLDADGMSDLFELTYRPCLDPLVSGDATNDCDADGISNLAEFQAGTDPTVANQLVAGLVINEVDYDQIGTDTTEFIELFNRSNNTLALNGLALVFVNGSGSTEYRRVNLSGPLGPGEYLVVASSNVVVAAGVQVIRFTAANDNIQNGAPDAVALIDVPRRLLLDALSYEGSVTAASMTNFPTVSLVEGTALPGTVLDSNTAVGSLIRSFNGVDSDDAASDWRFSSTPTPGAANVP